MRSEDIQPFTDLMRDVARTYRRKLTDLEIGAFWRGVEDLAFARVRDRLVEHQHTSKFFPTISDIRSDGDEGDSRTRGPEPYSPEWHRQRHEMEQRIAVAESSRRAKVVTGEDAEEREAARRMNAAARGAAVYAGTAEGDMWERRYALAAMQRQRIGKLRELARLEALPPSDDDRVMEARAAWLQRLRSIIDTLTIAVATAMEEQEEAA